MASKNPSRRIVVGERAFTWQLGQQSHAVEVSVTVPLRLTLYIRAADDRRQRIEAVFHGQLVPFLFSGHEQDLLVTPRIVRRVIEIATERGWPTRTGPVLRFDAARELVPEVSLPLDVADSELRAACAQWFVAYPGRAALQAAWDDCDGDVEAMGQRLGIESAGLSRWLDHLGIRRAPP